MLASTPVTSVPATPDTNDRADVLASTPVTSAPAELETAEPEDEFEALPVGPVEVTADADTDEALAVVETLPVATALPAEATAEPRDAVDSVPATAVLPAADNFDPEDVTEISAVLPWIATRYTAEPSPEVVVIDAVYVPGVVTERKCVVTWTSPAPPGPISISARPSGISVNPLPGAASWFVPFARTVPLSHQNAIKIAGPVVVTAAEVTTLAVELERSTYERSWM